MHRSSKQYRVLLVSSSGGVFLDVVGLAPWWSHHETRWIAVPAKDTTAELVNRDVVWTQEPTVKHPLRVVRGFADAWGRLRRERPDFVVSAGNRVAVPFFVAAYLLRVRTIWVDTLNLIEHRGRAARLCTRLASAVVVQQPSLLARYPGSVLIGELY